MKGVQRDGLEYDFTLVFELNIKHMASCSKDRTQLFTSEHPQKLNSETGEKILTWCNEGENVEEAIEFLINSCNSREALLQLYDEMEGSHSYKHLFTKRNLALSSKLNGALNQTI